MKELNLYLIISIIVAAIITFALRALPFVIFRGSRKMPETVSRLGQTLPATIMAVLIIHRLKDSFTQPGEYGWPGVIAVLAVGITYKLKHNTLLSIVFGTVIYMVLLRI